jgi:hypothetical protein
VEFQNEKEGIKRDVLSKKKYRGNFRWILMDTKKEKKGEAKFGCDLCDFYTSHKSKYETHFATLKHQRIHLDTKKGQKGEEKDELSYVCECCDYVTCDKTKYERHLLTPKHEKTKKGEEKDQKRQLEELKNICVCGNAYVFPSGLYKHRKKCNFSNKENLMAETLQKTTNLFVVRQLFWKEQIR